jgi:putative phosphoribosyl transferase
MYFLDRAEAGRKLAQQLIAYRDRNPVVLALPRGGVPIGVEVASALDAPLDVILVRKIGAPSQPELALGAIVDGDKPEIIINEHVRQALGVPESYIRDAGAVQLREIERRRRLYFGERQPLPVAGRTAILVDDGIATGATMRAALHATRRRQPAAIVVAVPVAPPDTIDLLRQEADAVICLHIASDFAGVGQFYRNFGQVDDATVITMLNKQFQAAPRHEPIPELDTD